VAKRVLIADGDIQVTSAAQRGFGKDRDLRPVYTTDVREALRQLSDAVLDREEPGSPRLYGAVIEALWPDAETPDADELFRAGLRPDVLEDYRTVLREGAELYQSSPPLGLLIALRADALRAPVALTLTPTSRLSARAQARPIQECAARHGWKCYPIETAGKLEPAFWRKCLTRFDNKWLERVLGPTA
jgi:hypothetical protein